MERQEKFGFLGRLGGGKFAEEILALAPIEKPANFDDLDSR